MEERQTPPTEAESAQDEATAAALAATKRMKRIAAANVIRTNGGRTDRQLCDLAVASRVRGILPSEVKAVREELDRQGFLADEVEQHQQQNGGG